MRLSALLLACSVVGLAACSSHGPRVLNPGSSSASAFELTPSPLDLTNDNPAQTFTVENDSPGVSYTPVAAAGCQTSDGGIFVAGNGQAQTAVGDAPVMFTAYEVGTPPASCSITVTSSDGQSDTIAATYTVLVVQSVSRRTIASVSPSNVSPSSISISKANQVALLSVAGFSGTTGASVSGTGCTGTTSGIEVNPKQLASGSGAFAVAAFGQGSINLSCSVKISDGAGNSATVPVTVAIGALHKLTAIPTNVQFACAGTALPKHCQTTGMVTIQEIGAAQFKINDKTALVNSCANSFNGPIKMTTGNGVYSLSEPGPSATVAFDVSMPADALSCKKIVITDGGDPAQTVAITVKPTLAAAPPPSITAAAAPPCKGNDPFVAMPGAPHGMYVWNPDGFPKYKPLFANDVIGKDPTLCGASLVIAWADAEPSKNGFNWPAIIADAKPYTDAGLTVNLLFADSTEGTTNNITPSWVLNEVPTITCSGDPTIPVYFNSVYEADWEAFIAAAVQEFSFANSSISANVGYMRFATAGGAEALPPPGLNDGGACQDKWVAAGYTYDVWKQHEINIVNSMGAQTTDKQLMVSLPNVSGGPTVYEMSNAVGAVAASKHIGFSFENLGMSNVAAPGTTPGACNPAAKLINLHWCQAYTNYAGIVPLAMQPITATSNTATATIDITNLLQYALDNNIQIFELYPDEWAQADSPEFSGFLGQQAKYQAALHNTSLVLGATH